VDVANGRVAVNYGANPSPAAALTAAIKSGYNSGAWNGTGVISSTIASNPRTAVGYIDGNGSNGAAVGTFLMGYALEGDTKLAGTVGLPDYNTLAANFNKSGGWSQGDFNYDGTVGLTDYNKLAANFNKNISPAGASIGGGGSTAKASLTRAATLTGGGSTTPTFVDPGSGNVALEADPTTGKLYIVGHDSNINSYEVDSAGGKLTFVSAKSHGGYNTLDAQTHAGGGTNLPGSDNPNEDFWGLISSGANTFVAEAYPAADSPAFDTIGHGLQEFDLNTATGSAWTAGVAISDLTFKYGNGTGNTLFPAVINLSATPEPAMLSLLGLGAMGLLARKRRKNFEPLA
jgi:hypothetical protein